MHLIHVSKTLPATSLIRLWQCREYSTYVFEYHAAREQENNRRTPNAERRTVSGKPYRSKHLLADENRKRHQKTTYADIGAQPLADARQFPEYAQGPTQSPVSCMHPGYLVCDSKAK